MVTMFSVFAYYSFFSTLYNLINLHLIFQGKGRYIAPINMLKRPPKGEDDHKDGVLFSKNVGSSSFQVKMFVNSIAGKGLYARLDVQNVVVIIV